jgi:hypothetical protein
MRRRVQVQPDTVSCLRLKVGIVGHHVGIDR